MKKFLKNLYDQIPHNAPVVIGMPAWFTKTRVHHLPLMDNLDELGYKRVTFELAPNNQLIYHRDDQVVGRELVVLSKI